MDVPPPPPPGPKSAPAAAAPPSRDNRALFARVLVAALLIGVLAVAAIFLVNKVREGDDNRDQAAALGTATANAVAPTATVVAPTATSAPPTATSQPPTATATAAANTPTPKGEQASGAASGGDDPTPTKKPSPPKIGEMLPTDNDVPDGFAQTENGKLTKDDVAGSFSDPADAATKLDDWQWKENVYRIYEIPADADHAADDVTYLYVSIHRFGSSDDASAALPFFAQEIESARDLHEIDINQHLGDEIVAAAGPKDGSNEVTLYIRQGNRLIRVTAFADSGDSTDEAVKLAKKVLAK
jgi:type II secretory pathway pseudopilin PulG